MAKWGEGDPRWIVEERPDAVNVNNWHWTEKNACSWSQDKFKELFDGFKLENDKFKSEITEIEKCTGEACANNRKGKLIFFYEWEITLKWKGKAKDSEDYVSGKIVIPNLSEENTVDEVEVNVSVSETTADADLVKEQLRVFGRDMIREQLTKYIDGLKAEFSQGMILPKKDEDDKHKDNMGNLSSGLEAKIQMNPSSSCKKTTPTETKGTSGGKVDITTLVIKQKFQCTAGELYASLTTPEMVAAFTQGPIVLDVKKGGKFELFGGNIHGEFVEVVPNKKIVQLWRYKRWPSGHFSTVSMTISEQTDHTKLKLKQTGVPTIDLESTRENWERYYWLSLKRTFGFGYFM